MREATPPLSTEATLQRTSVIFPPRARRTERRGEEIVERRRRGITISLTYDDRVSRFFVVTRRFVYIYMYVHTVRTTVVELFRAVGNRCGAIQKWRGREIRQVPTF